jgi:uncharacterized protein (TIGR04255 family)
MTESFITMGDPAVLPSPFSNSERIIYARNPLSEVICQLRFPPILRIAAEPPAAFQEKIRSEYPLLNEGREAGIEIPPGIPVAVAEIVKGLPRQRPVTYDFLSEDGKWKAVLTREFLALTTSQYTYTRWEEFRRHLDGPLNALIEVYAPAFFSRVGLRYQNVIRRSRLGLPPTTNWSELIQSHMTGLLAKTELSGTVEELQSQALIKLAVGSVRVRSGIVETDNKEEVDFLIDNDFFTAERTKTDDVDAILRHFNRQAGRLFRWCIKDRLHDAMEPYPVDASA